MTSHDIISATESLATAAGLPARQYACPDHFRQELDRILRRDFMPVMRVSELPDPASYIAIDHLGEPLLIVRDKDGTVRALSNVCRHRSIAMLVDRGPVSRIMCPYHNWTYALDGGLVGAPCMEKSQIFDKAALGLKEFSVEIWHGWICVSLDATPTPLAERLAPLNQRFEELGIASWVTARTISYDAPWNWKLMMENFSESYHHLAVHTETLNPQWPAAQTFGVETNGHYAELRHPVDPEAGTFTVFSIFPALSFALSEPSNVIYWPQCIIRSVDSMELRFSVIVPEEAAQDEAAMDGLAAGIDYINKEDFPVLAAGQRGMASRYARPGPLSHLEQPLWLFHRYLDKAWDAGLR
jgi:nitrite reductase/ring-hydroxylating ferredoxin subunit